MLRGPDGDWRLDNDFVLLLTGYRSDIDVLRRFGIELDERDRPIVDPDHYEADSRPGVHLAGGVLCGQDTGSIFIENGREHAVAIAEHLTDALAIGMRR